MGNWYKDLKDFEKKDGKIIGVAVDKLEEYSKSDIVFFNSLEEAKKELNIEFDDGYGGENGRYFTAWTKDKVYFPICYDGSEWIGCAPRNPCRIALRHQGGG